MLGVIRKDLCEYAARYEQARICGVFIVVFTSL